MSPCFFPVAASVDITLPCSAAHLNCAEAVRQQAEAASGTTAMQHYIGTLTVRLIKGTNLIAQVRGRLSGRCLRWRRFVWPRRGRSIALVLVSLPLCSLVSIFMPLSVQDINGKVCAV